LLAVFKGIESEVGGDLSWIQKRKGNWPIVKASLKGAYHNQRDKSNWNNKTLYENPYLEINDEQYRHTSAVNFTGALTLSAVRSMGCGFYLEPSVSFGTASQSTNRSQWLLQYPDSPIDSLSTNFSRIVLSTTNGITLNRNQNKLRWSVGLNRMGLWLNPILNQQSLYHKHYNYYLPFALWEKDLRKGMRINIAYNTSAYAPRAHQLMPLKD
jgi:hypothetical protein